MFLFFSVTTPCLFFLVDIYVFLSGGNNKLQCSSIKITKI
nr:MAG TPA: hypothetical protein [Caudoviricetes sp.]